MPESSTGYSPLPPNIRRILYVVLTLRPHGFVPELPLRTAAGIVYSPRPPGIDRKDTENDKWPNLTWFQR
jgi:hypothetical protein